MGELGKLIQAHKDEQGYRVSNAAIAERLGVTRSTVGNWIAGDTMPGPENVQKLADLLGFSRRRVLEAVLADAGYLPKEREDRGQQHAPIVVEISTVDPLKQGTADSPRPENESPPQRQS